MEIEAKRKLNAYVGLFAGFLAVLSSIYYIEQISYYLGEYMGVITVIRNYNINTTSSSLLTLVAAGSTLRLGAYIAYMLFVFAIILFGVGIVWTIKRQFPKIERAVEAIAALSFLLITFILEFNFSFGGFISEYYTYYVSSAAALFSVLYPLAWETKARAPRKMQPIEINPATPYTNMMMLSNRLMKKLSGDICILDPHFDSQAVDNLSRMVIGNESRYRSFRILANGERFGREFWRTYLDFKSELSSKGIDLEIRILQSEDAITQHERLIIDDFSAYKIPPLNIINKKSEHIVGVGREEVYRRFEELWSRATKYENLKSNSS
ncbi:MAG: hypothetical protein ACP5NE_00070 [Candidatus Micrarchaeia archaeon]